MTAINTAVKTILEFKFKVNTILRASQNVARIVWDRIRLFVCQIERCQKNYRGSDYPCPGLDHRWGG